VGGTGVKVTLQAKSECFFTVWEYVCECPFCETTNIFQVNEDGYCVNGDSEADYCEHFSFCTKSGEFEFSGDAADAD